MTRDGSHIQISFRTTQMVLFLREKAHACRMRPGVLEVWNDIAGFSHHPHRDRRPGISWNLPCDLEWTKWDGRAVRSSRSSLRLMTRAHSFHDTSGFSRYTNHLTLFFPGFPPRGHPVGFELDVKYLLSGTRSHRVSDIISLSASRALGRWAKIPSHHRPSSLTAEELSSAFPQQKS